MIRLMTLSAWSLLVAVLAGRVAPAMALDGNISPVHDPSIIYSAGRFYLFCTGTNLPVRTSVDLFHWSSSGCVFSPTPSDPTLPAWTRPYIGPSASVWAPDVSYFNGQYHLYYAVSTFGSRYSAIGLVTTPRLDPAQPAAHWTDRGPVISTAADATYNAIDPAVFVADDTHVWMVFGSWWSGIKLAPLNPVTGLLADPARPLTTIVSLACRPNHAGLEEGYLTHRNGFYYLWASFDHCCRGSASDYSIRVGRSAHITGPYADRDNTPMLQGGGTPVLQNQGDARGPGSCAILHKPGGDWLVYHFYDAARHGTPTLQIRPLTYDPNGWPAVGEPITGPISSQ